MDISKFLKALSNEPGALRRKPNARDNFKFEGKGKLKFEELKRPKSVFKIYAGFCL